MADKSVFPKRGKDKRPRAKRGEVAHYLREVVFQYEGDDCLLWPYSRGTSGYAQAKYEGQTCRVHILACEKVNGSRPFDSADAAHSCGNGHLGCVNPKHLSWKTHAENMSEMIEHGTSPKGERHGMVKLTESEVRVIRSLAGLGGRQRIAEKFGVSRGTIKDIQTKRSWSWLE